MSISPLAKLKTSAIMFLTAVPLELYAVSLHESLRGSRLSLTGTDVPPYLKLHRKSLLLGTQMENSRNALRYAAILQRAQL